jgi:hypothetical protein
MKTKSLSLQGFEFGRVTKNHEDQDRQTFWNEHVIYGDMIYDDYKEWEAGYRLGLVHISGEELNTSITY